MRKIRATGHRAEQRHIYSAAQPELDVCSRAYTELPEKTDRECMGRASR